MANLGTMDKGEDRTAQLTARNGDGSLRNITTDTITFTAKYREDEDFTLFTKTVGTGVPGTGTGITKLTQSGGTLGRFDVTIDDTDTDDIARSLVLQCYAKITDSSGKDAITKHTINVLV